MDPIEAIKVKIAVLSQMRDAIKQVAPNYVFRSIQHRDEVYAAIIEASEELEDELQDLEDAAIKEEANEI
jgi:type III secretion protein W